MEKSVRHLRSSDGTYICESEIQKLPYSSFTMEPFKLSRHTLFHRRDSYVEQYLDIILVHFQVHDKTFSTSDFHQHERSYQKK